LIRIKQAKLKGRGVR